MADEGEHLAKGGTPSMGSGGWAGADASNYGLMLGSSCGHVQGVVAYLCDGWTSHP